MTKYFKDAPKSLIKRLNKSVTKKDRKDAIELAKQFSIIEVKNNKLAKKKFNGQK